VLARPIEEEHAAVLAFLTDGSRGRAQPGARAAASHAPCSGHSTRLRSSKVQSFVRELVVDDPPVPDSRDQTTALTCFRKRVECRLHGALAGAKRERQG